MQSLLVLRAPANLQFSPKQLRSWDSLQKPSLETILFKLFCQVTDHPIATLKKWSETLRLPIIIQLATMACTSIQPTEPLIETSGTIGRQQTVGSSQSAQTFSELDFTMADPSYAQVSIAIEEGCAGQTCHSSVSPTGVPLGSYSDLVANFSSSMISIRARTMPIGRESFQANRDQIITFLENWQSTSFQESSVATSVPMSLASIDLTSAPNQNTVSFLINEGCLGAGCHDSVTAAGGIILESPSDLIANFAGSLSTLESETMPIGRPDFVARRTEIITYLRNWQNTNFP